MSLVYKSSNMKLLLAFVVFFLISLIVASEDKSFLSRDTRRARRKEKNVICFITFITKFKVEKLYSPKNIIYFISVFCRLSKDL